MNNSVEYCSLNIDKDVFTSEYLRNYKCTVIKELMIMLSLIILNGGKNKFIIREKRNGREYYESEQKDIYIIKPLENTELDNICDFFRTKGSILGNSIKINIIKENEDADFTVPKNLVMCYFVRKESVSEIIKYGWIPLGMEELIKCMKQVILQYEKEHTLNSQFEIDIYELFLKLEELCGNEGLKEFLLDE